MQTGGQFNLAATMCVAGYILFPSATCERCQWVIVRKESAMRHTYSHIDLDERRKIARWSRYAWPLPSTDLVLIGNHW
ncbi:hypothetical protein ELI51_10550 [Rhizobium leguminosarum]|nr:hypothetical protein ELI50_09820 [Rhizobium leguminosarum]TAU40840.1 hypothetical protein ELI51_10550 [Rhizobium leguminosarum]TAV10880.1 hypothetical protein ELI37_10400 [Rhizobium leguminosarum]